MSNEAVFLEFSARQLRTLAGRIGVCLDKLTPEQVWLRHGENENAVGNLVLHLCGNVRQWIGMGVAGMPDIRDRDREFAERGGLAPSELKERLNAVVEEAAGIVENLPSERLSATTTIQSRTMPCLEAIYHVVEHFSQHTGQIVFATKLHTSEDLGFFRDLSKPGA
jgi:uncharacterized damage-inducible protein DinB